LKKNDCAFNLGVQKKNSKKFQKVLILYKLFFLFCLTVNIYVGASTWQEYWIKAVEQCDQRDHLEAINMFNLAVTSMEEINDLNHPHVYVDRARLNLLLENHELAIEDLNKALDNPNLSKKEISRATVSRVIAKSRLGMEQEVLDDLKLFSENIENKPVIEETSENIIIRNVPECPCYQNIMTFYYIDSGICTSEKDIQKLKSNIWVIKKSCGCGCGCSSNKNVTYNACNSITCGVQNNQVRVNDCKKTVIVRLL